MFVMRPSSPSSGACCANVGLKLIPLRVAHRLPCRYGAQSARAGSLKSCEKFTRKGINKRRFDDRGGACLKEGVQFALDNGNEAHSLPYLANLAKFRKPIATLFQ